MREGAVGVPDVLLPEHADLLIHVAQVRHLDRGRGGQLPETLSRWTELDRQRCPIEDGECHAAVVDPLAGIGLRR